MSFFASAFAPTNSGPSSSSSNPFKPSGSNALTIVPSGSASSSSQPKKRKRPVSANGENNKRDLAQSGQVNLEKLMKKVGMVGNGSMKDERSPRRSKSSEKQSHQQDNQPASTSAFGEESAEPRQKKQRVKVGLDGRPINQAKSTDFTRPPPKAAKRSDPKPVTAPSSPIPSSPNIPTPPTATTTEPSNPATPMTKLQSSLSSRLDSAKFRWINEQLYTQESGEAWEMMKRDGGGAFKDYHKSHRQLTSAWPSPPLPHILALLEHSPAGTFIVDLGCGDAGLAKALTGSGSGSAKKVLSFDLVGDVEYQAADATEDVVEEEKVKGQNGKGKGREKDHGRGWVVPCDFLNHVPLPGNPGGHVPPTTITSDESVATLTSRKSKTKKQPIAQSGPEIVDVVVCCLSLMGINWVGGIYEACRIIRTGGKFHIAEVTSRLISKEGFIELVESFGFKMDKHTSPTTHFDLFEFTKTSSYPLGIVRGQNGWEKRVKSGEEVMKGCVYKKR